MVIIIPGNSSRHQANSSSSSSNCVASLCLVSTSAFAFVIKAASAANTPTSSSLRMPPCSSQLLLCLHNMAMSMTLFASQPRRRLATRMRCAPFRPGHARRNYEVEGKGQGQWVLICRRRRGQRRSSPVWFCRQKPAKTNAQIYVTHTLHCGQVSTYLASVLQAADTTVDTHTHTHTRIHTYVNEYTLHSTWPAGL